MRALDGALLPPDMGNPLVDFARTVEYRRLAIARDLLLYGRGVGAFTAAVVLGSVGDELRAAGYGEDVGERLIRALHVVFSMLHQMSDEVRLYLVVVVAKATAHIGIDSLSTLAAFMREHRSAARVEKNLGCCRRS